MRGRGRGRGRGSRGGFARSVRKVVHTEIYGRKLTVSRRIPEVVEIPWNSLTLQIGSSGDFTVTGKDMAKQLTLQSGITTATFDMRVKKIRVWGLQNKRPIRVQIFGWDNTNIATGGSIAILTDFPDTFNFAAVGYEFSAAMNQIVLSSDSTDKVFSVDVGSSYAWLAYVDILWRANVITPISYALQSLRVATETSV